MPMEFEADIRPQQKATKALFALLLNPHHGITIGFDSVGPAYTGKAKKQNLKAADLTPLRHLSDIRYLTWEHECQLAGVPVSTLKYHLASDIRNDETRDAVRDVLGGFLMVKLPFWPGVVISESEHGERFTGLLGTPVGVAMGRFLAQRKETMGRERRIVEVRLWRGKTRDNAWVVEHGPPMYALFVLSDLTPGGAGAGAGLEGVGGSAGRAKGGVAPGGRWGKGKAVVEGQGGEASGSVSVGEGQKSAKASLNEALQQTKLASGVPRVVRISIRRLNLRADRGHQGGRGSVGWLQVGEKTWRMVYLESQVEMLRARFDIKDETHRSKHRHRHQDQANAKDRSTRKTIKTFKKATKQAPTMPSPKCHRAQSDRRSPPPSPKTLAPCYTNKCHDHSRASPPAPLSTKHCETASIRNEQAD